MANTDENTLNEKIARVDRLETKLSDSIMSIQGFDKRIKSLESIVYDLQILSKDVKKSIKDLESSFSSLFSKHDSIDSTISSIAAKLDQQKKVQDDHTIKQENVENKVTNLCSAVDEVGKLKQTLSSVATKADVLDKHTALNHLISLTKNEISKVQSDHANLKDVTDKLISSKNALEQTLESALNKIQGSIMSHSELAQIVSQLRTEISSKFSKFENSFDSNIEKKIKEKLPSIDKDSIAEEIKGSLKTDIAHIATDASNASLKYNNVDAQVKLLEKKIENIYLLIKKAELAKNA